MHALVIGEVALASVLLLLNRSASLLRACPTLLRSRPPPPPLPLSRPLRLPAAPLAAKDSLGVFDDWGAFRDPGVPRCYAIAMPERRSGAGDYHAYASVGTWPRREVRGQVHVRLSRATALLLAPEKMRSRCPSMTLVSADSNGRPIPWVALSGLTVLDRIHAAASDVTMLKAYMATMSRLCVESPPSELDGKSAAMISV